MRLRIAISNNEKDHQLNSTSSDFHEAEADSGKLHE